MKYENKMDFYHHTTWPYLTIWIFLPEQIYRSENEDRRMENGEPGEVKLRERIVVNVSKIPFDAQISIKLTHKIQFLGISKCEIFFHGHLILIVFNGFSSTDDLDSSFLSSFEFRSF